MVGGYDDILQPMVVDDRFDYVVFTDEKKIDRKGVWEIRTFDYHDVDKTRESRYPKMHPEELLPGYEAWLYTDANIQITGTWIYERFMELYEQRVEWGGHWHCDTLFDHIYCVLLHGLESKTKCIKWSQKLRKEGFPRDYRIFENNVIFRLNSKNVLTADQQWWKYYNEHSRRDQCILSYVFWNLSELHTGFFVPKDQCIWDNGLTKSRHEKGSRKNRSPYLSYPGYVQLRFMNNYSGWNRRLNDMFYNLSAFNRTGAHIIITLVSWLIFLFYAPAAFWSRLTDKKYHEW